MDFDAAMSRIAEELLAMGQEELAERVTRARADMREAGYGASPGAAQTRSRLHDSLQELSSQLKAEAVKDDLVAAIRWIPMAGEVAREVSAKHHLSRHPSRDIHQR